MNIIVNTKLINIEDANIGQIVKSFNITTGIDEFRNINNVFQPIVEQNRQHELIMSDGGTIVTSDIHPMLVYRDNNWVYVDTKEVVVGDIVKDKNNTNVVTHIKVGCQYDEQFYDISVECNNNYYATSNDSTNMYVVHNSGTTNTPFFTWEIEKIIHLKSTKSTEENQVRGMDYCIHIDDLFLERAKNNQDITLFSMEETRELYNAFYDDGVLFRELYDKYENKKGIRKKKINALQLLTDLLTQRFETGRIYILFANNVREQNRLTNPVYMTNLCCEILLNTKPIMDLHDKDGEIATCILSCVNMGKIDIDKDLEDCCDIIVRFLDELIDYQIYPIDGARNSTINRRNLGVGISDWFHFLAKNKIRYNTQEGLDLTHKTMEKFQYNLIKASVNLAKEKGTCNYSDGTKYSQGLLPIDLYNKNIDNISNPGYECDWENLREDLKKYGIRHSVLSAIPPTASSSLVSNSTPGVDAPRSLLTVKVSKKGTVKQLVPNFTKYSQYYTTAWELNNIQYLKMIAVMQKFIDQSISTNENFDIRKYEGGAVPINDLITNVAFCSKYGLKTLYYLNINDGSGESSEEACTSGACAV